MAGAGRQAEAQLEKVVKENKGEYIAVVEGSIPLADDRVYCTIGGRSAKDIAEEVVPNAKATTAIGACPGGGDAVADEGGEHGSEEHGTR